MSDAVGQRIFSAADQERFATLSGDWNPIHMDPVYARRTTAGHPVVHGIHLLLSILDRAAGDGMGSRVPTGLEASFGRFVLVGETTTIRVREGDSKRVRLELLVNGAVRSEVTVRFDGTPSPSAPPSPSIASAGVLRARVNPGRTPLNMTPDAMAGFSGTVAAAAPVSEWTRFFPKAAHWLGGERLAALGASTRLVGMVCPGLHSIYMGLAVALIVEEAGSLRFRTGEPRHGLVRTDIAGGGIAGTLTCLIRAAPQSQRRMADLVGLVPADAFAGSHALVVGGSRGLGEVAAKLLASGGAAVTVTYARGADEARGVAADIGQACTVIRYDVAEPAGRQLAMLEVAPTHVYYFATPQIARPASRFFDSGRFDDMLGFYVRGFWNLASAIRERRADARLFYPSTSYVADRPKGMAEYAMAKAAGEVMCEEVSRVMKPLRVITARLPQLATDQTLTSHGASGGDAAEALVPIVRAVQNAMG